MKVFISFKNDILIPSKNGWVKKSTYLIENETAEGFVTEVMNENPVHFFCLVINDAQVQIAVDNISSFTIFYI